MWLSSGSTSATEVFGVAVGGVATVFAAVAAGWFALRGSARNTDAEREKNFDERVDAELAALRAENAALKVRVERARYQLAVHNINPNLID